MLSSLDPAALRFLNGLDQIQQRAQRAQREMTTGLRINTVSDDPDQIANLIQTRADLDRTKQIDLNLGRVKTEVDTSENALQGAVKLLERAETLGSQGQSNVNSPDIRNDLAGELGGILEQLVSISRTNVDGRYVFSGDSDQQPPYTVDLALMNNAISPYEGSAATRKVQSADGSLITVSRTAQDIFDSPNLNENVFVSINNLRVALLNNDQAGIDAALSDILSAGTHLNSELAFYGVMQDRIAGGMDFGANLETQLQTQISQIQDADLAQSITELTQAKAQLDATLSSRAKMPMTSLFNYLA
jgi:flagellar hook-associated protein 3 FlgL